jgi:hypothetical protein
MATWIPRDTLKATACERFWGNSGSYELAGDTLTFHPVVAKDPDLPKAEKTGERYVRVSGETLWLTAIGGPFLAQEVLLVRLVR